MRRADPLVMADGRGDSRLKVTLADSSAAAVPSGRWSRLARLGSLASGLAGGMLAEGARQLAPGNRPRFADLLLTPANARRVTDQLAQLRGAAMKLGQLLSMDSGDLLPGELGQILGRLRGQAKTMPLSQLAGVLDANWGADWQRHFERFSFTPVAAASIGQVHLAQTRDGRQLAIKVQYPGVRRSIDSDVDNVAALLRVLGVLPKGLDIGPLLQETRRQLHAEADYLGEGVWLRRYAALLADAPEFIVPELHADLTTANVLAMTRAEGIAIESLIESPQAERDRVLSLLFGLLFREIFEFQLIQTDANFANYRYDPGSGKIILLDFGATRAYPPAIVDGYRQLLAGAMLADRALMDAGARAIGYFHAGTGERQQQRVLDIFALACEPLRHPGPYDFGQSDLAARVRVAGLALSTEREFVHTPPADAVFLHRKLAGLYLLAARLSARVDVQRLGQGFLA